MNLEIEAKSLSLINGAYGWVSFGKHSVESGGPGGLRAQILLSDVTGNVKDAAARDAMQAPKIKKIPTAVKAGGDAFAGANEENLMEVLTARLSNIRPTTTAIRHDGDLKILRQAHDILAEIPST